MFGFTVRVDWPDPRTTWLLAEYQWHSIVRTNQSANNLSNVRFSDLSPRKVSRLVPEVSLSVTKSPTTLKVTCIEANLGLWWWKSPQWSPPPWAPLGQRWEVPHRSEKKFWPISDLMFPPCSLARAGLENKVKWSKGWPGRGERWRATRVWGRCWRRRGGRGRGGERTGQLLASLPCLAPVNQPNINAWSPQKDRIVNKILKSSCHWIAQLALPK